MFRHAQRITLFNLMTAARPRSNLFRLACWPAMSPHAVGRKTSVKQTWSVHPIAAAIIEDERACIISIGWRPGAVSMGPWFRPDASHLTVGQAWHGTANLILRRQ